MTVNAYPLSWPPAFARTARREVGVFRTTLPKALKNVETSLQLFAKDSKEALTGLIMSSNVTLGNAHPADPGVAVWFTWGGLSVSIAVDRYTTVEANLQAIHHIIEARRVELRHGTLVRATFHGFLALPAPAPAVKPRHWRDVLTVPRNATREDIKDAYRRLASVLHPDKPGGSGAAMAALNVALEAALKETP